MPEKAVEVQVEGRTIKLTNLDKVLYPEAGFAKGQMIDYYTRVAPAILPHLKDRPVTLKRYPDGTAPGSMFFYEKNCPKHRPPWVSTAKVWSWGNDRWMDYCVVDDLPTLVWVANLASLELHTSLSLGKKIEQPRMMVYDLDPGPPADIVDCCEVGIWLRDYFAGFGLESFAKTSGSKGLQLYVPVNTPITYDTTQPFARALAEELADAAPKLVVAEMARSLRAGKVFIDWSQNATHKTTVGVYSLRAKRDRPYVSLPITW